MPFKETCPVQERIAMLREWDTGAVSVAEITRRYGVSRETFYVWKRRRESADERWFEDRSSAPGHRPHTTPEPLVRQILALRERFPHYGAKKLRSKLLERHPKVDWPAASTIGDILKRGGLIVPRPRRQRPVAQGEEVAAALAPNDEWSIDFKGWFRTWDGTRCDPLTVPDTATRYLLETRIVAPTYAGVRGALERLFAELGLPAALRCDNGPPFGSRGAGGLSRLSVWWLKLGVEPRYIRPASPQDNGRHERMHRTLKAETTRPPAATLDEPQARFDAFRRAYNEARPHEALGQRPPARVWRAPARMLPPRVEEPWYDADHVVRRVRPVGTIKWRGEEVFIGEALAGEIVGVAELASGCDVVRFCHRTLGVIGRDMRFLRFAAPRSRLREAQEPQAE